MLRSALVAAPVLLLAACASPYEQCVSRATTDLRVVDRLIQEKTALIERGYAIEEETYTRTKFERCYDEEGKRRTCRVEREYSRDIPVAVNLDEQREILAQLHDQRATLDRAARSTIASCRAAHPEG
ncbi:hypothetical protein [Poseidonocella sedimentorum]|uniref:Lipoprotein n=1 Tax=Poseidonocella sedimentorum TaxID=871652 RepID=A0A1I6DUK8_9RHOB|nr:hypothetical protein [Poseidonocella sedimentorum]SFR09021.1 hypothetical protein SAMN04515673_105168 [Poseidonocella sedimentorum]